MEGYIKQFAALDVQKFLLFCLGIVVGYRHMVHVASFVEYDIVTIQFGYNIWNMKNIQNKSRGDLLKILTWTYNWRYRWQYLEAFMKVEQFVAGVFIPDPNFDLKLMLDKTYWILAIVQSLG